ncbi:MoaD/ThiS family protein [Phycicoccus sonneratiae]|uniref:MoaD/ThiS family protein n=1 Tax=Phycicoccus sonneratiae TaxID=2807628 RepID=A0ABS2CNR8_9MICO|nr:MoaD/ThiS family protein [Phycicoccus sonneraticus]MBM6401527.1 MoaD/ThiS family protein [Phycicoccus sonneraticus]
MDARHGASTSSGTTAEDGSSATVSVRYWAGARAAAGVDGEVLAAPPTVEGLVAALAAARPGLAEVLPVCSVLVDGLAASGTDPVPPGALVEVLPPFAGG